MGAEAFFDRHLAGTDFVFQDDLWISFFLALNGVRVIELPLPDGRGYEQVHQIGALSQLGNKLARDMLTRNGIDHLIAAADMPPIRRARMRFDRHVGHFVARPARRVVDRLQRSLRPG